MTDPRTLLMSGYLVTLEAPYDDRVARRYIAMVLSGDMTDDEFWPKMRQEFPILPLEPIRDLIASGAIVPAPPKTPATDLVDGGWYWMQKHPGGEWEIARVELSGDDARFSEILKDWSTDYDDILAIGPLVPDYAPDETDHEHSDGPCPLCPSEEQLAQMRQSNRTAREAKRAIVIAEIEKDPSAFVFVVEGYDNLDDRMPVIMRVATSAEQARAYVAGVRVSGSEIYEVTPHRLDSDRTGEVALFHVLAVDGCAVERRGGRRDGCAEQA